MAHLRPLGSHVLIRPLPKEQVTKSGIVLPESAQEKSNEGKVIAVGPGKYVDGARVAPDVQVGDKVLYKESWGDKVKIDGEEHEIIDADSILAVFEPVKKGKA